MQPGLPVELWMEIFLASVEQQLQLDTYTSASAAFAPLVLTRVCSLWRSIALAEPRLWRHLVLFHDAKHTLPVLIQRWAERSRPYTLFVHIRSDDSVWFIGDDTVPPSALDHFSSADAESFLHRVECLDTVIPGYASERIFGRTPASALSLRELRLDLRTWSILHRTNLARLLDNLQHAAHLRHLSLDYPAFALMPPSFPQNSRFPFAQLTALELRAPIDATALTRFLHCCPALQELTLSSFFLHLADSMVGNAGREIVLPHLRRLAFASPKATLMNERCLEFFSAATLPLLESLAFPAQCSDAPSLAVGFSRHSGCRITSLEVSEVQQQHTFPLLAFLARHDTIEHLAFPHLAQTGILKALCPGSWLLQDTPKAKAEEAAILPRLRTLQLVLSTTTAPRLLVKICDAIPALLDSRRSCPRLERVEVLLSVGKRREFYDAAIELLRERAVGETGRLVLVLK